MRRKLVAGTIVLALLLIIGFVSAGEDNASLLNTTGPAAQPAPVAVSDPRSSNPQPYTLPVVDTNDNAGESGGGGPTPFPVSSAPSTSGNGGLTLLSGSAVKVGGNYASGVGRFKWNNVIPTKNINVSTHPAVISRSPGVIDMFYYNSSGWLNYSSATAADIPEWPSESTLSLGPYTLFSPAVCSWGSDHLAVFLVGTTPTPGEHYISERNWTGSWGYWTNVPGVTDANSTPAVVSRSPNNIELVYRNTSGYLIHMSKNSGVWTTDRLIVPQFISNEGVSLVSTSSNGMDIIMHYPALGGSYNNQVWTLHWDQSAGWDASWNVTGMPAYSFVGASTRSYTDGLGTTKFTDVVYDPTGSQTWYWNVSKDGGATWHPESYTGSGSGNGYIDSEGGPFTIVSPRYNRVEFYDEYLGLIWEDAYKAPSHEKAVIYRNGMWVFDYNGNFQWDGTPSDRVAWIGQTGDTPVVGDWNGDGIKNIGIFRNGMWVLDYNGNYLWDGTTTDRVAYLGQAGDTPVVGDWNGDGRDEIGIFRNGMWVLDYNGNFQWDGTTTDRVAYLGQAGDTPVVGDWNGNGTDKIGVFRNGMWVLDYNGNYLWDGTITDRVAYLGQTGDTPVSGNWNGDGTGDKIGVFRNGLWVIDYNGNFQWDGTTTDRVEFLGQAGDTAAAGEWA